MCLQDSKSVEYIPSTDVPEEQYECFNPEDFFKESGLKYIPLYSLMLHAHDAVRSQSHYIAHLKVPVSIMQIVLWSILFLKGE